MKLEKKLIHIIKKLDGNILGFGLTSDQLLDEIANNKNIIECNLLNLKGNSDDTSEDGKKLKDISISRLRKKFKKKKTDYIIASADEVEYFLSSFIKDSIFLSRKNIYLFFEQKDIANIVIKKYQRYHTKIEQITCNDGIILNLDVSEVKSTKWKDWKYSFLDKISLGIDIITEIMTS